MVFPYSEFQDKTIQGIDAQVEFIPREGFGNSGSVDCLKRCAGSH